MLKDAAGVLANNVDGPRAKSTLYGESSVQASSTSVRHQTTYDVQLSLEVTIEPIISFHHTAFRFGSQTGT